jgi:acyl-CoA reductase-like NAD-dependent aldehyde dehydrogenase
MSIRAGTAHGKRVQRFGGAKNHMVIMPDADMDQAADALMGAAYGSAGERCMAISVAVPVGEPSPTRWSTSWPRVEELKIGPSTDETAEMGPLVTKEHLAKVKGYVDQGEAEGAKLVVDGRGFNSPAGLRERLLHGRHAVRQREARHDDLQGRDLRPGAVGRPPQLLRGRRRSHSRP